ncbi:MAG: MgtC/SapB family protein [Sphingobacterium hotanense]
MELLTFTTRILVSLLLGIAIGMERQWRQRSAGLRTNTLVALGATVFVLLSIHIGGNAIGRIASYIVSGIGFLGAGVIMKDGQSIQGLNTAATIWCSAAVGSLCGLGLFPEAAIVTLAIVCTHLMLRPIGLALGRLNFPSSIDEHVDYILTLSCNPSIENQMRVLLIQLLSNESNLLLKSLSSDDSVNNKQVLITAVIKTIQRQDSLIERVVSRLTIEEQVYRASWEISSLQNEL